MADLEAAYTLNLRPETQTQVELLLTELRLIAMTTDRQTALGRAREIDELIRALPAAGLLRFTQNGAQLELDSHNGDLRRAYRNQALAREARWQRLAQKLGVPLLPLSTQLELVEQLQEQLSGLQARKSL